MDNIACIISKIDENTWQIDDQGVRFFLLEGNEKAMLIDTGMNVKNAREIAQRLTDKPLELINTHADRDHIASNYQFEKFYMHLSEGVNYYGKNEGTGEMIPVAGGDILDLGERKLKIFALPGHTPGSIAILDMANRRLFSGDSIQRNGNIYMFGPMRDFHAYIASLVQLKESVAEFDEIYPSHSDVQIDVSAIDECIAGAKKILAGEISGEKIKIWGDVEATRYDMGYTAFLA